MASTAPSIERVVVVDDIEYRLPYWVAPSGHPSHDWLTKYAHTVTELSTGKVLKQRHDFAA